MKRNERFYMSVEAQVDAFFDYTFANKKHTIVFSHEEQRQFWVDRCARHRGVVIPDQYVNFETTQRMLSHAYAQQRTPALRVLSSFESELMMEEFLSFPNTKSDMERLEKDFYSQGISSKTNKESVDRFEEIFRHYPLFYEWRKKGEKKIYECIRRLLRRYDAFLEKNRAIDAVRCTYALFEERRPCNWNGTKLLFWCPRFLAPHRALWLRQCQKVGDGLTVSTASMPSFRRCLSKSKQLFAHSEQELDFVASRIRELLDKGEYPINIALTICEPDVANYQDIEHFSRKYGFSFSYYKHDTRATSILDDISDCVDTYMHPKIIQRALFHPNIPWKRRKEHLVIAALGARYNCVDTSDMKYWHAVLSAHSEEPVALRNYFFDLYRHMRRLCKARDGVALWEELQEFEKKFCARDERKGKKDGKKDNAKQTLWKIKKHAKALYTHHRYRIRNGISFGTSRTAWELLRESMCKEKERSASFSSSVAIYTLEQAMGVWHRHHFFVRFTQQALLCTGRMQTEWGERAVERMFSFVEEKRKQNNLPSYCKRRVSYLGENVCVSASLESLRHASIPAFVWKGAPLFSSSRALKNVQMTKGDKEHTKGGGADLRWKEAERKTIPRDSKDDKTEEAMFGAFTQAYVLKKVRARAVQTRRMPILISHPFAYVLETLGALTPLFPVCDEHLADARAIEMLLRACTHRVLEEVQRKGTSKYEGGIFESEISRFVSPMHPLLRASVTAALHSKAFEEYWSRLGEFFRVELEKYGALEQKRKVGGESIRSYFPDVVSRRIPIEGECDLAFCDAFGKRAYAIQLHSLANNTSLERSCVQLWANWRMWSGEKYFYPGKNGDMFYILENFGKAQKGKAVSTALAATTDAKRKKIQTHAGSFMALFERAMQRIARADFADVRNGENGETAEKIKRQLYFSSEARLVLREEDNETA